MVAQFLFTKILKSEYEDLKAQGKIEGRGVHAVIIKPKGRITARNVMAGKQ